MSSTSKKITYTRDFKLKVLDYYFKNGGDENFGLKTRTAEHFNIDKKTINRMLNNPDIVKRARRLLARRHGAKTSSAAATASTSSKSSRSGKNVRTSRVAAAAGGLGRAAGGGAGVASSGQMGSSSSGSGSSSSSRGGVKILELPEDPDYSILKRSFDASANGIANMAKLLVTGTEEVQKLILNECDVILECKVCRNLFRSLVNFLAHKRVYCQDVYADVRTLFHRDNTEGITSQSGTVVVEAEAPPPSPPPPSSSPPSEGRRMKARIDSIADQLAGRTGRSGSRGQSSSSDLLSASSHPTHTGSARYYERLESVNSTRDKLSQDCSVVLEDIRGVSTARFQTFQPYSTQSTTTTNTTTNTTASTILSTPPMSQLLREIAHSSGVTAILGEQGEVLKEVKGGEMVLNKPLTTSQHRVNSTTTNTTATGATTSTATTSTASNDLLCTLCKRQFTSAKTLAVHQRSHHGINRHVYTCPICKAPFSTMLAIVKHLEKFHKKSKHQTDRLKRVIRKNVIKKCIHPPSNQEEEEEEEEEEERRRRRRRKGQPERRVEGRLAEAEEEKTSLGSPSKTPSSTIRPSRSSSGSPASSSRKSSTSRSALKRYDSSSGGMSAVNPECRCDQCHRCFMTPQALISHRKFCSLKQMKPPQAALHTESPLNARLCPETPEKRIAIQIRKDYKKSLSPAEDETKMTRKELKHEDEAKDKVERNAPRKEANRGVVTMPDSATTASKVEALMRKLCRMSNLTCIPCGRRYQSITTLKRHVSAHFNWTRYACRRCKFRSYNRYELTRHATHTHGMRESNAAAILVNQITLGPVRYSLTEAEASEGEAAATSAADTVETNGIKSEEEEEEEEEEEAQVNAEMASNDSNTDTGTHKPDTHTHTNAHQPHTHISTHTHHQPHTHQHDTHTHTHNPMECQTSPHSEENQRNGLPRQIKTEETSDSVSSPHGLRKDDDSVEELKEISVRANEKPKGESEMEHKTPEENKQNYSEKPKEKETKQEQDGESLEPKQFEEKYLSESSEATHTEEKHNKSSEATHTEEKHKSSEAQPSDTKNLIQSPRAKPSDAISSPADTQTSSASTNTPSEASQSSTTLKRVKESHDSSDAQSGSDRGLESSTKSKKKRMRKKEMPSKSTHPPVSSACNGTHADDDDDGGGGGGGV